MMIVLGDNACPFPHEWITPCPCSATHISTEINNCKGRVDFEYSASIMDILSKENTTQIQTLDLSGLNIQIIENKAFFNMDHLKTLSFSRARSTHYERLKHIKSEAFLFRRSSTTPLELDISYNSLNSSSFDKDVFKNSNRPLNISALYNWFGVLDKEVFSPFFEKFESNHIDLGKTGTFCENCENAWLIKNNYIKRVLQYDYGCSTVLNSDPHYYDKCK